MTVDTTHVATTSQKCRTDDPGVGVATLTDKVGGEDTLGLVGHLAHGAELVVLHGC